MRVRQRAHLAVRVEGIAEHDRAGAVGERRHQLILDRAVHEQPRAGDAGLARGGEDARHHPVAGGLERGVVEHELG